MDGKINNLKLMSKRGQITIFIIIAILIVVAIILLFSLFGSKIIPIPSVGKPKLEPNQQIIQCTDSNTEDIVNYLIEHNFYSEEPLLYKEIGYKTGEKNGIPFNKYPYLCYTSKERAKCIIQEPVIIDHLEKEIYNYLKPKIEACFDNVKIQLEKDGYLVSVENEGDFSVELVPGGVKVKINKKMSVSKSGSERKFDKFSSYIQSPLYNVAIASQEVVRQESKYCNSDYVLMMRANPKIEISKFQTGDDNKIYTIKDILTGKLIRFAVRGCVIPTPS